MINSFKHKGLKLFYETGSRQRINPGQAVKLARILDRLDASKNPQDMNLPGYKLHPLTGEKEGAWAVTVSGNWRLTFEFAGEDASKIDYLDYH